MLTREGAGQKFVTACFALAISDATLERLFLVSIKNFLIDEAKKTPRGKLRRVVEGLAAVGVTPDVVAFRQPGELRAPQQEFSGERAQPVHQPRTWVPQSWNRSRAAGWRKT